MGRKRQGPHDHPPLLVLQLKCCGFNNYTDFEDSPYFTENKVFPPYCCSDDVNGTELCTKKRAEDKPVQVWAGMEVWCCFNGLRVLKQGAEGRQELTLDALFPSPRVASNSF